jgi:hypothetical protein
VFPHLNTLKRCGGAVLALAAIVVLSWASAVAVNERKPQVDSTQPAGTLHDDVTQLEGDLATLIERRPEAPPAVTAIADLQIDLRVLAHYLLAQSATEKPEGGVTECAYLRSQEMLGVADAATAQIPRTATLSAAQLDALSQLHQLTFKLPETKTVAGMDDVCQQIGTLLLKAGGPLPPKIRTLPRMRPAHLEPATSPGGAPRTLADLNAAARQAPVSPALRRELVAIANATIAAAGDKDRGAEASALYDVLVRAIDIAGAVQQGGAAEADARQKIETQLTDGLALFLDPRMRTAGRAKIDELSQYRQMLEDARRMTLPAGTQEKLGPAFVYAQRHVEQGPKLLSTIRQFLEVVSRQEGIKPPALPPVQKKVFDSLRQNFIDARQAFLTDAAKLGDTSGFQAVTPEQLRNRLTGMQDAERSIELIGQMPDALTALTPYKPRPTGALDRRALVWVSAVGGVVQSPSADDARQLLQNLRDLGEIAQRLTASATVSPEIDKLYAHGHYAQFNNRRSDKLSELASATAAGKDVDHQTLARLQTSQDLADALRDAAFVEMALKQTDLLHAWVDWDVAADTLGGLLHDYREATATVIENMAQGDFTDVDRWPPAHNRIAPVLALAKSAGGYIEQCRQLPTGWAGEVAKLLTPMDRQPFAAERYASLMLAAYQHVNVATITSEVNGPEPALVLDALTTRLRSAATQPSFEPQLPR